MFGVKTTEALKRLTEKAIELGGKENSLFTAEKFVVAVIEECLMKEANWPGCHEETSALKDAVSKRIRVPRLTRRNLRDYISQHTGYSVQEDLYMRKVINKAKEIVEEPKPSCLDALTLFNVIVDMPTKELEKYIWKRPPQEVPYKPSDEDIADFNDKIEKAIAKIEAKNESNKDDVLDGVTVDEAFVEFLEENLTPPISPTPEEQALFDNLPDPTKSTAPAESSNSEDETIRENMEKSPDFKRLMVGMNAVGAEMLRKNLSSLVYGQDNAIDVLVNGYFKSKLQSIIEIEDRRPKATFLFAGPPGVGKTFLAESVAQLLDLPFRRFDMSEYSDKEANLEFCGVNKSYKDSKSGNVTGYVDENPTCVLLFDEVEKAHLNVIHLFYQMLDAGFVRDNYTEKEVSFKDCIIILTTNAGRPLYEDSESGDFTTVSKKVIMKALQKDINPETKTPYFPAALCSRFASGNVVMFNYIKPHSLIDIAKREINGCAEALTCATDIDVAIDDNVYSALMFSEGSSVDARTMKGTASNFINNELFELFRLMESSKVGKRVCELNSIRLETDLSNADKAVQELFCPSDKTRVLVIADDKDVATFEGCENVEIIIAKTYQEAIDIAENKDVNFALVDIAFGMEQKAIDVMNIEDVPSFARDFLKFIKDKNLPIPVYLLETEELIIGAEEKTSLMRQGIRDTVDVSEENKADARKQLETIANNMRQQASMKRLARENKLVSFSTSQTISKDGKDATIKLFDFELKTAIDAEDAKSILNAATRPKVRFDEVIGADDAKEELKYFVEYLKDPKKYKGTGVKAPRGVLLYGPPGTGKTMLAKAMACEADVTFLIAEGNQFVKKHYGEGPEAVHRIFKTARKYAPSILFIDEIDAIAKERTGKREGVEETLTAFLTEMDGFASDPTKPVFVLAATNYEVEEGTSKSLDPALMRRFDRRVYIDLPNKEDRTKFLRNKIESTPALAISETTLKNIAVRTTGMSLAALDSVIELALRSAIRSGSTVVTDAILEEALETFTNGEVKKWDESQLERVARHEAGHALMCWLGGETPSYLTVVARGGHGGYMQFADNEGKALYTKDELLSRIRTALGGRAAEIVYYGEKDGLSTGARGDLVSATRTARNIVCSYGMDEKFGLAVEEADFSGSMSPETKASVNEILAEQMQLAINILLENRDKIDRLVETLKEKNHMNSAEIEEVLRNSKIK